MEESVGTRVRARLEALGMTQVELSKAVGMTEDALSLSLRDKRNFKLRELASVGDALNASVHWLITGERAPYEVKLSARHGYDYETQSDTPHDWGQASRIAGDIALIYSQVGLRRLDQTHDRVEPGTAIQVAQEIAPRLRAQLGETRPTITSDLPSVIEDALGVDVFVIGGEPTFEAYSAEANGVPFIAAHTAGGWYRVNWNIAHELGHILHGDLAYSDEERQVRSDEAWANAFAGELLAPGEVLRAFDWTNGTVHQLTMMVLNLGISTHVLRIRLGNLGIGIVNEQLRQAVQQTTMNLCRFALSLEQLAEQGRAYSRPRFPKRVVDAHWEAVRTGHVDGQVLAWMLDAPIEDVNPLWSEGHAALSSTSAASL